MFPFRRRATGVRPSEVLDLVPEAIALFDRAGRCSHANALALVRWGAPGLAGRAAAEVFSGRDEEVARSVAEALQAGTAPTLVGRFARPEGELRVLRVRGGALVIGRGPTESAAAPTSGVAPELARRLSHDLVQPLASIANYAELIRGTAPPDVRRYAERIAEIARKAADALRAATAPPDDGDPAGHA